MPNYKPLPPLERLNELFEIVEIPPDKYGKWSGLVWKVRRSGTKGVGSVAGTRQRSNQTPDRIDWMVGVDGNKYVVSRVIYFMTYGEDPRDNQVDHKDQNSLNNNPGNLRLDVDGDVQEANKLMRRDNTSGVVGVTRHKTTGKWQVYVSDKYLGLFTCKIEAAHAVNKKWRELGWVEKGRKLNDLSAIQCDCDKCKSQVDKITE